MKKILGKSLEIIIVFLICNIAFLFLGRVNAATSVSGGSVDVGDTITVNFSVTDNNGGFSGNVSYDTGKLEYVSSSVSGTGSYNNGSVAIVGGDSFSVTFRAKSSGNASVSLNNIMLGDGSSGSGSSATINIKSNAPAPTINEGGGDVSTEPEEEEPAAPAPVEEAMPNFSAVNDTIYASRNMNVRSGPDLSYRIVGGLSQGQALTRTGIGDNGWSRVIYGGSIAYVSTELITTEPPEEEQEEEQPEETSSGEQGEDAFSTEEQPETPEENPENQPETPEETKPAEKTEEEIYNEIVSKVGTIPEVGTNYNIYAFILIVIVSILSFGLIIKK